MGLFDKKTCVICGGQSGVIVGLFGETLADGSYMCGKCRSLCTPAKLNFKKMTPEEVKANMAVAEANKKKGTEEFRATRKFQIGRIRNEAGLDVDETHGWFVNAAAKDGWVYNLDDLFHFDMSVSFAPLAEGEAFLFKNSDYAELPSIPDGVKITGAKLMLWLLDNELGVDHAEIVLVPDGSSDEHLIRSAYATSHEFFEFMRAYRAGEKAKKQ